MSNYSEYEKQASRLYEAIVGEKKAKIVPFSADNLWDAAWKQRKNKKITDFIFDEIVNVTSILENNDLRLSEAELDEQRRKLASLIVDIENGNAAGNVEQTALGPLLEKLSMRSKEAVVDSDSFSDLKKYMHVKRPIQDNLEQKIQNLIQKRKGIIFLVGNVGDGKSHLLAYMKDKYGKEFNDQQVEIINDATESDSPTHTAIETLVKKLDGFNDESIQNGNDKLIIAINLGVITNLLIRLKQGKIFNELVDYLEKSGIVNGEINQHKHEIFSNVSFVNQTMFEVNNSKIESDFFLSMFNKVFSREKGNPFYEAYLRDINEHHKQAFHDNYRLLLDSDIKNSVIYLLIRAQVEYKEIISARTLMNFMYDIVISNKEKINYDSYLPFLIFDNAETLKLLKTISFMDPTNNQNREVDELSVRLFHSNDVFNFVKEYFQDDYERFKPMFDKFRNKEDDLKYFRMLVNTMFRVKFLLDARNSVLNNSEFQEFVEILQDVITNKKSISLFKLVDRSLRLWNGTTSKGEYVVTMRAKNSTAIAVELELEPISWEVKNFGVVVKVENQNAVASKEIQEVEVDYKTYVLLKKVVAGYILKREDIQTVVKFDEFVNSITRTTKGERTNILYNPNLDEEFELKKTYDKVTLRQLGE